MTTVETLLKEISGLELSEGDRLPSERILAERCSISRTSIRNALKELQSSSILASRERSGYYLASQFALRQALSGKQEPGKTTTTTRGEKLCRTKSHGFGYCIYYNTGVGTIGTVPR